MIKETEKIGVLNYNENRVSVIAAPDKSYSFDPSDDGVTPTVIPMTIDEIRYINNSNAFKNGTLFFDKSREEDVYNALGITDWESILTNQDIREIILHPTYEGLEKIIAIKDSSTFERVRAAYQKLKVEDVHDISVRVAQIISTRYKELLNRQISTSIELTKRDIPQNVNSDEMDKLKAQNEELREQMAQMQEMIKQMIADKQSSSGDGVTVKKSPGRPKKNS